MMKERNAGSSCIFVRPRRMECCSAERVRGLLYLPRFDLATTIIPVTGGRLPQGAGAPSGSSTVTSGGTVTSDGFACCTCERITADGKNWMFGPSKRQLKHGEANSPRLSIQISFSLARRSPISLIGCD
jgi:hypothetical protein